ncbi:FAD-binding protein [Emcibacter sp.]|uniref:FAD-binding protein n=1 Tax=Emcibacter sp. TaxID=1979954 RepID=UPI002AA6B25C|nr:FAD-binding protein [Emcibacter sp.]
MNSTIINDVTGLNPVPVWAVVKPQTTDDVITAVKRGDGPISIGGGRFSMGGQTTSRDSLHIDMRLMNKVLLFNPEEKYIQVQAGIRWCDIQKFIDPHNLSVKIMQTYANFTVGGSLGVNCHGRYIGLGPLIMSVRWLKLVLGDGSVIKATPTENSEIFFGAIGGYGGLGIIVEAKLDLVENERLERTSKRMKTSDYLNYFVDNIRSSDAAVFHNADLYPDHYSKVNAVTWSRTKKAATTRTRLHPVTRSYWIEKYFFWRFSETLSGNWVREHIIDPLLFTSKKIHWRNYEAGYDVAELEPLSREKRTYVLQEYFVPIKEFEAFTSKMSEILNRYKVNVINISIRHAKKDPGSLMAWANDEVFAFVLYYKQRTRENARQRVALWTRALISAVLEHNGTYYLPYQAHATHEQFHAAYPRARELFSLKSKYDPDFRFRNVLWDAYYGPDKRVEEPAEKPASEFHKIYKSVYWRDRFYLFLQNVFRLFPEDRFHTMIIEAVHQFNTDEEIYKYIQANLPTIKPALADFTYALPALRKQKAVISGQTVSLLESERTYNGYLEIGSTGRYYSALKKLLKFKGTAYFTNYIAPTKSPPDIIDRGQVSEFGPYFDLNDYAPISKDQIPSESLDLVTCYIGLHHIEPGKQKAYVDSIARTLRPGGVFILRDHDSASDEMKELVALVHTVFNAGTGETWKTNTDEPRYFQGLDHWVSLVEDCGLKDQGQRLYQDHDPSDNVLMAFIKCNKRDKDA